MDVVVLAACLAALGVALYSQRAAQRLHESALGLVDTAVRYREAGDAAFAAAERRHADTIAQLQEFST